MPSLSEIALSSHREIVQMLITLENSSYLGRGQREVSKFLTHNESSRYLAHLILNNDVEKSAFEIVDESHSKDEQSPSDTPPKQPDDDVNPQPVEPSPAAELNMLV